MELNLHNMVGKKYDNDTALKVIEETEANPLKVDFRLLCELMEEGDRCMGFGELIGMLEMDGIPMTDAVRKLGICTGVLYA